jgi:SAM-dependent methyltransferase
MDNSDQSWSRYGETEPYFGVITDPRFERRNLTEATLEEFFRTGEEQAEALLEKLRDLTRSKFTPSRLLESRVLEYGCGVGRVLIPLAERCGHVTGIDISEGMLKEAEKNCRARNVSNVSFVLADDALSRVSGSFDLIHSFIVFQHIPVARGIAILSALIDRLAIDGVAAVHLTYLRDLSALKNFVDWARARSRLVHFAANLVKGHPVNRPLMQMNAYDLNRVFSMLQRKNCQLLHVDFINNNGYWGGMFYIQKKAAIPSQGLTG